MYSNTTNALFVYGSYYNLIAEMLLEFHLSFLVFSMLFQILDSNNLVSSKNIYMLVFYSMQSAVKNIS